MSEQTETDQGQRLLFLKEVFDLFKPMESMPIVLSIPIDLAVQPLPLWMTVKRHHVEVLEPVPLRDGTPAGEAGYTFLRTLLLKRLHPDGFTPQALELLIEFSGGLPGTLLQLTQEALIVAADVQRNRIEESDVDQAIETSVRQIQRVLTLEDIQLLMTVDNRGRVTSWTPRALELLRQGDLILTPSAARKVMVPPLVRRALPTTH